MKEVIWFEYKLVLELDSIKAKRNVYRLSVERKEYIYKNQVTMLT